MFGPGGFEKHMRIAIALTLAVVVVIAPLIGVFTLSPFLFAYGLEPYQLAVALSVMLAEALALAGLYLLVLRSRK